LPVEHVLDLLFESARAKHQLLVYGMTDGMQLVRRDVG
jgi:hypothetical protein